MIYSLDTNVCIRYLKGTSAKLVAKVRSIPPNEVIICSIVKAELFYSTAKSNNPTKALTEQLNFLQPYNSLSFDDQAAEIFGTERARLEKLGLPIGSYDLLIASIALANGLILVAHNVKEFSRIQGLTIEDWKAWRGED